MTPDEKTVVFNSFNGKTYGCSPKAVYEYMLTQDEFKDWTFIWAFKNAKKHRFLEENPNTIVVKQTARVYEKKTDQSKILDYELSCAGSCLAPERSGLCAVLAWNTVKTSGI